MQDNLDKNNFRFKKNFGQNFIIDKNVIDNIISKSGVDSDTLVIEIGPGAGSLSAGIASKCGNLVCFEIDKTLKPILEENLKEFNNIEIIFEDFLTADVNEVIKKYNYKKIYVIANLPYYITTPIITKIIEKKINVDKVVVMVQKEVGDRFKATPGSKDYSSLSIFLKYYFDVFKILDVSRNVFMPKPNVDSIVVEFVKTKTKFDVKNEEFFFKLVRDSFTQKRKTLRNNLKAYDLDKISEVLAKYNFDLSVRAEQLPIEIFIDIANTLC